MYEVAKGSITLANNDWNVSLFVVLRDAELCVVMIVTLHLLEFFQFIALGSKNSKRKETNYNLFLQTRI
jgi:hypothetical protein